MGDGMRFALFNVPKVYYLCIQITRTELSLKDCTFIAQCKRMQWINSVLFGWLVNVPVSFSTVFLRNQSLSLRSEPVSLRFSRCARQSNTRINPFLNSITANNHGSTKQSRSVPNQIIILFCHSIFRNEYTSHPLQFSKGHILDRKTFHTITICFNHSNKSRIKGNKKGNRNGSL